MGKLVVAGIDVPDSNTDEDLVKIVLAMNELRPVGNWQEAAIVSKFVRDTYFELVTAAMGAEVVDPGKCHRMKLWNYRDLMQTSNCVRLGTAVLAERGEEETSFVGGAALLADIKRAYAVGKVLNAFTVSARMVMNVAKYWQSGVVDSVLTKARAGSPSAGEGYNGNSGFFADGTASVIRAAREAGMEVGGRDVLSVVMTDLLGEPGRLVAQKMVQTLMLGAPKV